MKIGVTIDFRTSLFSSGIGQNGIYLVKLFENMGYDSWVITNNKEEGTELPIMRELKQIGLSDMQVCTSSESLNQNFDIVVFLGLALPQVYAKSYRKNNPNIKFISYKCGNEFFTTAEAILFNAHPTRQAQSSAAPDNIQPDVVWSIPQMEHTNLDYYKYTQVQERATVVPFVWDPMCIEAYQKSLGYGYWEPREGRSRIAICESNVNIQKHLMYPIIMANKYMAEGNPVEGLHIYNADKLAENKTLISFINTGHPELIKKVKALARKNLPTILAKEADVLLSWQMENNLNYVYLDAAWLGYPVVHNANLCQDVGYYYEANQVDGAVEQLKNAFNNHTKSYRKKQREIVSRYRPNNQKLQDQYKQLMEDLLSGEFVQQKYDWKTNTVSPK